MVDEFRIIFFFLFEVWKVSHFYSNSIGGFTHFEFEGDNYSIALQNLINLKNLIIENWFVLGFDAIVDLAIGWKSTMLVLEECFSSM
jgi:hypothetical protein